MKPRKIIWKDTLCCEPIIRKTPFGLLLLVECGGGKEPDPDNKVLSFIKGSSNQWDGPYAVWPEEKGAQCLTEACVIGEYVYGFFCRHNGMLLDFRSVIRKSKDGKHWADADEFAFDGRNIIFRGATTATDGRVLLPYQRYIISTEDEEQLAKKGEMLINGPVTRVENGSVILQDGKLTCWSESPAITTFPLNNGKNFVWTESAALWYEERSWMQLIRMDGSGVLYKSTTIDDGSHWSEPEPTGIPNPGNKVRIEQIDCERCALIHTPSTRRRNPLEIWYSRDKLQSFYLKERISNDGRAYHYADTCMVSDVLNLVIERDRKEVLLYKIDTRKR